MSRYRLLPTPTQDAVLRDHCGHARYVWNLAVEQHSHWHPGRRNAPGYLEQCRQLTQARAEHPWLAAGSQTVQQQALRDFAQAMAAFFEPGNPAGRPSWRKAGRDEGFRITGRRGRQWDLRRVSRKIGQVWVPKAGWVRFRWSRAVPPGAKSYRVTMDRAGRWHVAFAVIPGPVPAPGNGQVVGIDRGVAVSAALSTGDLLHAPGLTARERTRLRRLQRKLAFAIQTLVVVRFRPLSPAGVGVLPALQRRRRAVAGGRRPGRGRALIRDFVRRVGGWLRQIHADTLTTRTRAPRAAGRGRRGRGRAARRGRRRPWARSASLRSWMPHRRGRSSPTATIFWIAWRVTPSSRARSAWEKPSASRASMSCLRSRASSRAMRTCSRAAARTSFSFPIISAWAWDSTCLLMPSL